MFGSLLSASNSGAFSQFLYVFLVPGAILWYFRSLFVVGRPEKLSENILIFVVSSALYAAVLSLPMGEALKRSDSLWRYLLWLIYVAALPALAIGVATQKKTLTRFLQNRGLPVKSSYSTGLEWTFGQLTGPVYLLITFDDGSKLYGYFGENSLASSDPEDHTIFIEEVWDFDESKRQWTPLPEKRGILVKGDSIRHIEIWNFLEEDIDESKRSAAPTHSSASSTTAD